MNKLIAVIISFGNVVEIEIVNPIKINFSMSLLQFAREIEKE
jgi:hypothetical protein